MAAEFIIGGLAASGACFFTNPLEVAKTRMQLQGELVARGQHAVHYRNVVHAFYTIGRVDGLLALQKGLVPAVWYQFVMNGVRLGFYQRVQDMGLTKDRNGHVSVVRSVAAGAFSGGLGAAVASPLYMVSYSINSICGYVCVPPVPLYYIHSVLVADYFTTGRGVKYCDELICMSVDAYLSVCLSLCISVRSHISKTTCPNHIFFAYVNCGHG